MILPRFRRNSDRRIIAALYGAIVAQARSTTFYAGYGVPDTVPGRFDLIVLHLVLVLSRLDRENEAGRRFGQRIFDEFCRDLDDNLREMGVGDLAVPKKMLRFGEAFYGRQAAYRPALAVADAQTLEKAFCRNIYQIAGNEAAGVDGGAARLARYALAAHLQLDAQDTAQLMRGELVFPNPEAVGDA